MIGGLALLLAPALALQAAGETPIAMENDAPESWTLEYPRLIQPYVADYRRCLVGRMRHVTGEATFEAQHRSDIPACEAAFDASLDGAREALAGRKHYADYTASDIRAILDRVARIHVARGADLDNQFRMRMQAIERGRAQYEQTKPRGLVLELRDASVVKARTDATAPAEHAAKRTADATDR